MICMKSGNQAKGVLLEDLDAKLDLLIEGQFALARQMDERFLAVDERFREVDYKFEIVFQDLKDLRSDIQLLRDENSNIRR